MAQSNVPGSAPQVRFCSMKDANLTSKAETSTPDIHFVHPEEHNFPIIVFRAPRPSRTARVSSRLHCDYNSANVLQMIKFWQIQSFSKPIFGGDPFILRIEEQELHKIENTKDAYLLLLEHAAYIPLAGKGEDDSRVQVSIMAMVIPKDSRVRWFYSVLKYDPLLQKLEDLCGLTPLKTIEPRDLSKPRSVRKKDHHAHLFTWMREAFLATIRPPHSPDYINACGMTDWAPEITMSEGEALNALAGNSYLLANPTLHEKDLSDDRYLLDLHAAERQLASIAELSCAEYLFIKRDFFRDWYREVMRTDKKIEGEGAVHVRTDYGHGQWLERAHRFSNRRARRLVAGWRELGLLEESALLPWIREGGMLAHSVGKMSGRDESDVDGVNAGQAETNGQQEEKGRKDKE